LSDEALVSVVVSGDERAGSFLQPSRLKVGLEATVSSLQNLHRKKGIAAVLTRAAGIMQRQQAVGGPK